MKLCKCIRCKQLFEKRDKSDVPTLFDMPKFSDGLCRNCLFEILELGETFLEFPDADCEESED